MDAEGDGSVQVSSFEPRRRSRTFSLSILTSPAFASSLSLFSYSMALAEIDSVSVHRFLFSFCSHTTLTCLPSPSSQMRVDGKFVDADGEPPTDGQYGLLYLLRRCYGLIYRLISSSEPVSEELMPIARSSRLVPRVSFLLVRDSKLTSVP